MNTNTVTSNRAASALNITHKGAMATIRRYLEVFESFGAMRLVSTITKTAGGDQQTTHYELNKEQLKLLIVVSKTTKEAMILKQAIITDMDNVFSLISSATMIAKPSADGFVYAVECNGQVKIGRSINVDRRIRCLETQGGREVTNTFYVGSAKYGELENKLLNHFKACRTIGEWFSVPFKDVVAAMKHEVALT